MFCISIFTYNILLKVDLQTLSRNLDRGVYATKGEFYADVQLMFDNEVLFNKGAESEWIVQLVTRMEHMFMQLKKMYDSGQMQYDGDQGADFEGFNVRLCNNHPWNPAEFEVLPMQISKRSRNTQSPRKHSIRSDHPLITLGIDYRLINSPSCLSDPFLLSLWLVVS